MEVRLAVLADYASVSIDNKLNIMGIFQEINTAVLPAALAHMYLVLSLEAEPVEHGKQLPLRVALLEEGDLEGEEIFAVEGLAQVPELRHPGDRAYSNQVIGLTGLAFERAGDYRFSVSVENEEVAVVPLRVNKLE